MPAMNTPRVCFALSLALGLIAPAIAHADRAPNPVDVKATPPVPPPAPPTSEPAKVEPAKVETKTEAKVETKTEAKVEAKTDAKAADAKAADAKKESGGMCRVGAPAGGWELLALLGLGLARRRRMS